jgi:hypothetical protein
MAIRESKDTSGARPSLLPDNSGATAALCDLVRLLARQAARETLTSSASRDEGPFSPPDVKAGA